MNLQRRIIGIMLFGIILSSCLSQRMKSASKPILVYNKNINDQERVKIKYVFTNDCKAFNLSVYKGKDYSYSISVKNCPKRFGVDKSYAQDQGLRFTYRLVSDTALFSFKCIDYQFLPQFCNSNVAKTFIEISKDDIKMFDLITEVANKTDKDFRFDKEDIGKFLGWVKIEF